jgi:hypothetical protein
VSYTPTDSAGAMDVTDGLEMWRSPRSRCPRRCRSAARPSPPPVAEHGGFPDFEVEPTVSMAPPPLPPRAAAPPPVAPPGLRVRRGHGADDGGRPATDGRASGTSRGPGARQRGRRRDGDVQAGRRAGRAQARGASARSAGAPRARRGREARRAGGPCGRARETAAVRVRRGARLRPPRLPPRQSARRRPSGAPAPRARAERPRPRRPRRPSPPPRRRWRQQGPLFAGAGVLVVVARDRGLVVHAHARPPTAEASPVAPPPVSAATPPAAVAPPVTEAAAPPETQPPVAAATPIRRR